MAGMQESLEPRTTILNNGSKVIVRDMAPCDCPGVSAMVIDNFRHAGNFDRLGHAARRPGMQASGNSRQFCETLGLRRVLEQAGNDVLEQRRIESFIAYLERPLYPLPAAV